MMENKKINIVMYAMSAYQDWQNGITNQNRQVVETLLADDRIGQLVLIDFLPFNWKKKIKYYLLSKIYSKDKNTIVKGWNYKVNKINDRLLVISTISAGIVPKILEQHKEQFKIDDYLAWSYNPMSVDFLSLPAKGFIFTAIDNWLVHGSFEEFKTRLEKNYQLIAKKADIIFTVADDLREMFAEHDNVYWIPNGVDYDHFAKSKIDLESWMEKGKNKIQEIKPPMIGYVGIIEQRFDFKLLDYLASHNPDLNFVILGPVWVEVAGIVNDLKNKYSNVHFVGPIKYENLPYYLNQFEVCLIPHIINEFTKSMNPLKIYEYLACGKPIVSTPIAGLDKFKDYLYISNDYAQFNAMIKQALSEQGENLNKYRSVAQAETWQQRINTILDKIERIIYKFN